MVVTLLLWLISKKLLVLEIRSWIRLILEPYLGLREQKLLLPMASPRAALTSTHSLMISLSFFPGYYEQLTVLCGCLDFMMKSSVSSSAKINKGLFYCDFLTNSCVKFKAISRI